MGNYSIKSYKLSLNDEEFGETIVPIDEIIKCLEKIKINSGGIVSGLSENTTVRDIVDRFN